MLAVHDASIGILANVCIGAASPYGSIQSCFYLRLGHTLTTISITQLVKVKP
jgi:hypothetical protein